MNRITPNDTRWAIAAKVPAKTLEGVRAKLPKGQGLWPAIWMMPTDGFYGGWPASCEIDIMELLGQEQRKLDAIDMSYRSGQDW